MARLLRSTSSSKLRAPIVVGQSVVFRAIKAVLAEQQRPAQYDTRRLPHSKLRPPTVLFPSIQFRAVYVKLTRTPRKAYVANSKLRPPAVLAAPFIAHPIESALAKVPKQGFEPHYKLFPPAVVAPSIVFAPVAIKLAKQVPFQGRFVQHYKLFPPILTTTAALAPPLRVALTKVAIRYAAKSKLQPPSVVAPSVVFSPIRKSLAPPPKQGRQAKSQLRPPAVVAPSIVFAPIVAKLSRALPPEPRKVQSKIYPPATLVAAGFIASAIRTDLARFAFTRIKTQSKLRAPIVVGVSNVFAPLRVELARAIQNRQVQNYKLRPPILTTTVVTALAVPIRVSLAKTTPRKIVEPKLGAPQIIAASTVFAPIDKTLARPVRQSRITHSKLNPPATLAVVTALTAPVKIELAATQAAARRKATNSKLGRPAIVASSITFNPIKVRLTQPGRQGMRTTNHLTPMIIGTPPVFGSGTPVRTLMGAGI